MHFAKRYYRIVVVGIVVILLCIVVICSINRNNKQIVPQAYAEMNVNRQAFYYFSDTEGVDPILLFSKSVGSLPIISVDLLSGNHCVYENAKIVSIDGVSMHLHLEHYINRFDTVRFHLDANNFMDLSTGDYYILQYPTFQSDGRPASMPDIHTSSISNQYKIQISAIPGDKQRKDGSQYDILFPDNLKSNVSYSAVQNALHEQTITLTFSPDTAIQTLDFDLFIVEKNSSNSKRISKIHVPFWTNHNKAA